MARVSVGVDLLWLLGITAVTDIVRELEKSLDASTRRRGRRKRRVVRRNGLLTMWGEFSDCRGNYSLFLEKLQSPGHDYDLWADIREYTLENRSEIWRYGHDVAT